MNTIYQSVWCETTQSWVATSEHAKARKKRASTTRLIARAIVGAALMGAVTTASAVTYLDANGATSAAATGIDSLAAGSGASAQGTAATAIGANATATADAMALGSSASATASEALAVGTRASATDQFALAIGYNASSSALDAVAVGTDAASSGAHAVSMGTASVAEGESSVALGAQAKTTDGIAGVALGLGATSKGDNALALGAGATASDTNSLAIGAASSSAAGGMAIGTTASVQTAVTGVAIGSAATVGADAARGVAIGTNASATTADSVALGANAKADSDLSSIAQQYGSSTVQGIQAAGEVSLGTQNAERRITHVAAGADGTDAVNVSQLSAVDQKVQTVQANTTLRYFKADGSTTGDDASAAASTYGVAAGSTANASGKDSVAIGHGANASADDSVALGAGSVTTSDLTKSGATFFTGTVAGATATGEVSVGKDGAERRVTHVAAAYDPTDAVNLSQLQTVADQVTLISSSGTFHYFKADGVNGDADASAGATHAVAAGAGATASATNSVAIGYSASATANNSVALGARSVTTADLSKQGKAFGNRTIAASTAAGEVSVGDGGTERRITHVAAGADDTDAVNLSQLDAVNNRIDNVNNSGTLRYFKADGQVADNDDAVSASESHAVAAGASASATAVDSVAVGHGAKATAANSVALGANSTTTANLTKPAETFGAATIAGATATGEVSVGAVDAERRLTHVAAAADDTDAVNLSQLKAVDAKVSDVSNNGTLRYFKADGLVADNDDAVATTGTHAVSAGASASATADDSVAIGHGANATASNSVALGANATTTADLTKPAETFGAAAIAGATATGEVSIGADNAERRLTHVAAAADDTDAVNLSQLKAVDAKIGDVSNNGTLRYFKADGQVADNDDAAVTSGTHAVAAGADASSTAEDSVAIGHGAKATSDHSVALGAGSTTTADLTQAGADFGSNTVAATTAHGEVSVGSAGAERRITNVAAGANDTDAVNLSQLKAVEQQLADATAPEMRYFKADGLNDNTDSATVRTGSFAVAAGASASADSMHSVSIGYRSSAAADDSVAIGSGASATAANSVALGAGSVADTENTVSVGAAGAERQITHVKAGVADTDAVNVAQLNAVQQTANDAIVEAKNAVHYDLNDDGSPNVNSITLAGDPAAGGTVIHNVAAGVADTDAVNLAQLNDAIGGAVKSIQISGGNPFISADGDPSSEGAVSSATHSVAVGASAQATSTNAVAFGAQSLASAENAIAVGANSTASAANGVAIGSGAQATASNSVALGQGSVSDRANTVSVGSVGQERQIVNVADGVQGTDAVNMNQLNRAMSNGTDQARAYTDDQIRSSRRDAYGGTASALAIAGLPQAVLPGRGMVAISAGTYHGESAVALGISQLSDTGTWAFKAQATTDSRGGLGATVGAGRHW